MTTTTQGGSTTTSAASQVPAPETPPRVRPSGQAGSSPAGKRARVGEFTKAPVVDEQYNDTELRMHVNVLRAEVRTLASAVEILREKHNFLTEDLSGAFTTLDDWGRTQEKRWGLCENELQAIKTQLGRHGQDFIDCGTFLNAQRVAAD